MQTLLVHCNLHQLGGTAAGRLQQSHLFQYLGTVVCETLWHTDGEHPIQKISHSHTKSHCLHHPIQRILF